MIMYLIKHCSLLVSDRIFDINIADGMIRRFAAIFLKDHHFEEAHEVDELLWKAVDAVASVR